MLTKTTLLILFMTIMRYSSAVASTSGKTEINTMDAGLSKEVTHVHDDNMLRLPQQEQQDKLFSIAEDPEFKRYLKRSKSSMQPEKSLEAAHTRMDAIDKATALGIPLGNLTVQFSLFLLPSVLSVKYDDSSQGVDHGIQDSYFESKSERKRYRHHKNIDDEKSNFQESKQGQQKEGARTLNGMGSHPDLRPIILFHTLRPIISNSLQKLFCRDLNWILWLGAAEDDREMSNTTSRGWNDVCQDHSFIGSWKQDKTKLKNVNGNNVRDSKPRMFNNDVKGKKRSELASLLVDFSAVSFSTQSHTVFDSNVKRSLSWSTWEVMFPVMYVGMECVPNTTNNTLNQQGKELKEGHLLYDMDIDKDYLGRLQHIVDRTMYTRIKSGEFDLLLKLEERRIKIEESSFLEDAVAWIVASSVLGEEAKVFSRVRSDGKGGYIIDDYYGPYNIEVIHSMRLVGTSMMLLTLFGTGMFCCLARKRREVIKLEEKYDAFKKKSLRGGLCTNEGVDSMLSLGRSSLYISSTESSEK